MDEQNSSKAGNGSVGYAKKHQDLIDGIVRNLKFLGEDGSILTAGKSGKVPPGQIKGGGSGGDASEKFQYFYHPDHLGSTSYITDASGEVYQHLEYFAFGETFVEEHSNTNRTPYLFNGKELDDETGLYYYGARYYDAQTSVWLSVDPATEEMPGWSSYSYAFNNPVIFIDPDGRKPNPPKIIALFYHGGPTGGGKTTTAENAGETGNIYSATQSFAGTTGRDFKGRLIAPGATSASGVENGLGFIIDNYEAGDQVIIYGYSYGVDVAVDVSEQLKVMGVEVDLLVTVDGSDGILQNTTVNTDISDNVNTNLNIYQTDDSSVSSSSWSSGKSSSNSSSGSSSSDSGTLNFPGSNGSPNSATNPDKTNVLNINMTGKGVNHSNIQQKASNKIQPLINTRIYNYE